MTFARINEALRLHLIVFFSGAATMSIELLGSRLVAPYLGSTIHVWTSLIGTILAALSLGYWLGGRLADRAPSWRLLALILFFAAFFCMIITPFHYFVIATLLRHPLDRRLAALIASLLLFSPSSIAMGMVQPFAVRLNLKALATSGATVGRLYALSTLGSLAGTFITGFFLIGLLGTTKLLLLSALVLLVLSFLADPLHDWAIKLLTLAFLLLLLRVSTTVPAATAQAEVVDLDTQYQRILVISEKQPTEAGHTVRRLVTDIAGSQSLIYLDAPEELAAEYAKYYELVFHFKPQARSILVIGGGAYTTPSALLRRHPDVAVDVVEIDPGITDIARKYFFLQNDSRMRIFHEDARVFLQHCSGAGYDAVFLDAFQASPAVPFQLTTREAFEQARSCLTDDGLLMMNLIAAIDGKASKFFRAELATLQTVFPAVSAFPVSHPDRPEQAQNIVLLALKKEFPPEAYTSEISSRAELLQRRWTKGLANTLPPLRDDFAPVEDYMLPVYGRLDRQDP